MGRLTDSVTKAKLAKRRIESLTCSLTREAKQLLVPAGALPAQAPGDNQRQFGPSHVTTDSMLQDPESLMPAQLANEYPVGCMWMHASLPRATYPGSRHHELGGMADADLRRKSSGGGDLLDLPVQSIQGACGKPQGQMTSCICQKRGR